MESHTVEKNSSLMKSAYLSMTLGTVVLALVTFDAYAGHILPGDNPLIHGDGTGYRGLIRNLIEPAGHPTDSLSPALRVMTGSFLIGGVGTLALTRHPLRSFGVAEVSSMIGVLGYELFQYLMVGNVSGSLLFAGALSSSVGAGLFTIGSPTVGERAKKFFKRGTKDPAHTTTPAPQH